jgi:hypothetical protein
VRPLFILLVGINQDDVVKSRLTRHPEPRISGTGIFDKSGMNSSPGREILDIPGFRLPPE